VERIYSGAAKDIRRRLIGPDAVIDFPILSDIKAQGGTDYAIYGLEFSGKASGVVSLTTDHPQGFSNEQLESFQVVLPIFSLVMESREWQRRSKTLLETHLGEDAGRRAGRPDRAGRGRHHGRAIWYCDLRDFGDFIRLPRDQVIALLNDYFDTTTRPRRWAARC
jgi:adenylate cyclase